MIAKSKVFLKNHRSDWLIPGVIAVVIFASMGSQIGNLGLYGDQWSYILQPETIPRRSFLNFFIQHIFVNIFGLKIYCYHLINLILFFIAGLFLYRFLVSIKIDKFSSFSSAILFIISPSFHQTGAGPDLSSLLIGLIFTLVSASFLLNFFRVGNNGYSNIIWAEIFAIPAFLSDSYIVCLQGLIFLVLLIIGIKEKTEHRIVLYTAMIINIVVPFTLLFGKFSNGLKVSINTFKETGREFFLDGVLSWRQIIAMPDHGRETILYIGILAVSIYFFSHFLKSLIDKNKEDKKDFVKQIATLVISICAGFLYLLVFTVLQIPAGMGYPNDMSMVVFGIPAGIFLVCLIRSLFLKEYQAILLALVIGLTTGSRYISTEKFIKETQKVNDLVAQLHVRGDLFENGTNILVEQLPLDYTSRLSIEAIINHEFTKSKKDVRIIPAESIEVRELFENTFESAKALDLDDDQYQIKKNKVISIWLPEKGCLQVLSPDMQFGTLPQGLDVSQPYSRAELFNLDNMSDVKHLEGFRTTIIEDWCFFYQQANRAFQTNEWNLVIDIYEEADSLKLKPERYQEFFPLMAAYIQSGKLQEAEKISDKLIKSPSSKNSVCTQWKSEISRGSLEEEVIKKANLVMDTIGCD